MTSVDLDRVGALVREVAAREILPRFRRLTEGDVIPKPSEADPDDIVTTADRATEAWLTSRLTDLFPEAVVVGEEGAARDAALLERIPCEPSVFVLDPVDGTKNFAAGSENFGVMLALLERGEIVASWIFLPASDALFVAEAGSGAALNGARIPRAERGEHGWIGTFHLRHLPASLREEVPSWYSGLEQHIDPVGCGAVEYTDIALGRKDFSTFYRLMPWDHLPGTLLLRECGGAVRHLDGSDYASSSNDQMIVAVRDDALWDRLRAEVFATGSG